MRIRGSLAIVAVTLLVALAGLPADAQDSKDPKGVTVRNLVTSLGGFSATVNAPILITGGSVALVPGGQTGRQPVQVPAHLVGVVGFAPTFLCAAPLGASGG